MGLLQRRVRLMETEEGETDGDRGGETVETEEGETDGDRGR